MSFQTYIIEIGRGSLAGLVLQPQNSSIVQGTKLESKHKVPEDFAQQWTFEPSTIPGVFFIVNTKSSLYLTASAASPTIQSKSDTLEPSQLWKFIPSSDGVYLLIQSYTVGGLVLDHSQGMDKLIKMGNRIDNDNQKYYIGLP